MPDAAAPKLGRLHQALVDVVNRVLLQQLEVPASLLVEHGALDGVTVHKSFLVGIMCVN